MHATLPAALHLATASLAPAFLAPWAAAPLASASALLRQLAQASLMGTLFVLAVWLLCRLAPRLPAGLRCVLWWLACLKLPLGLAWPAPVARELRRLRGFLARSAPVRDVAVLRLGAAPASYGRLLLRLGVRSPIGGPRSRRADLAAASAGAATVGGAAASLRQLKRRLEMLQHHQPAAPPRPARLRGQAAPRAPGLAASNLPPSSVVAPSAAAAGARPPPPGQLSRDEWSR